MAQMIRLRPITQDTIFGKNAAQFDVDASCEAYTTILLQRVEAAYPGVTVVIDPTLDEFAAQDDANNWATNEKVREIATHLHGEPVLWRRAR